MGVWSIYVSEAEEKVLKKRIEQVAAKRRWSFSQAVSGLLKEHFIDEKTSVFGEDEWNSWSAKSFFDGYPEKDSIYDKL
jgi:hypothetical protein